MGTVLSCCVRVCKSRYQTGSTMSSRSSRSRGSDSDSSQGMRIRRDEQDDQDLRQRRLNELIERVRTRINYNTQTANDRDAIQIFNQLEKMDPYIQANAKDQLGVALYQLGHTLSSRLDSGKLQSHDIDLIVGCWGDLGNSHHSRFKFSGVQDDLEQSIHFHIEAISLAPDKHENFPFLLSNYSTALQTKFEYSREPEDIEKAIECSKKAMSLMVQSHVSFPDLLRITGGAYTSRFNIFGNLEDINISIELLGQATSLSSEAYPNRLYLFTSLGASYFYRFRHTGDIQDITQSIKYHTSAIHLIPSGHPSMPVWANNLGNAYKQRFEYLGNLDDINEAIKYNELAVATGPNNHVSFPQWLSELGSTYHGRYKRLELPEDLSRAFELMNQAVSVSPNNIHGLPIRLNNLADVYQTRFDRSGDPGELEEAMKCYLRAISLTPTDHVNALQWLNGLGLAYLNRFQRLGSLKDVDKAIELFTEVISKAPKGHADISHWSSCLGSAYSNRFLRLNQPEDINKAIEYHSKAVSLSPEDHAGLQGWLTNLGTSYQVRFRNCPQYPRTTQDIDMAIELDTRALALVPQSHENCAKILNNLGLGHRIRFEFLGRLDDINMSIEYISQALGLAPEGHSATPGRLSNLAASYELRFELQAELKDIEQAIHYNGQAVLLTPEGHANLPRMLNELGSSYLTRFKKLDNDSDALGHALECFRSSAQSAVGNPRSRFEAARAWAAFCSPFDHDISRHLEAFKIAMGIVPELVSLGSTIGQRYRDMRQVGDLATDAAATAIDAEDYGLALEWLEQGRSIVWSQTLQLRTPLERLYEIDPLLYDRFRKVTSELQNAGAGGSSVEDRSLSLEQVAQRHRRLAEDYERVLGEIRSIQGQEDFLVPKKASALVQAAKSGPVVVINTHESHCDALILRSGERGILHVPLPNLTDEMVQNDWDRMHRSLKSQNHRQRHIDTKAMDAETESNLARILADLWTNIAQPVIAALGYTTPIDQYSGANIPHVTWCTTKALSFLPLHAAGLYDRPQTRLSDFVISSYTPTLGTLLAAPTSASPRHLKVLAVGQESTPGQTKLPGTTEEVLALEKHACERIPFTKLCGKDGTTGAVLDAMEQHDWVHLACHAHQNLSDPTESGFFLEDGILSLERIAQRGFEGKGLAFLSACQTATGDENLPDESVHLAASMLAAGYPSVIATMWSIKDDDASFVADRVYGQLLGGGNLDYRSAALALHNAVGELRAELEAGETGLMRWVPFVHIGS
ncbi:unnamed protein product [Rhizoctonia solani]|uniref:CHAT domain-containing protein n=1 Tax=Rhizoctonia solani TaxID=456999 RepID=A0A8H3EC75_9AGAM|nr:unnamed protein product [Rhizoctonia solani]